VAIIGTSLEEDETMNSNANDRRTAPDTAYDPERMIINQDIMCRISRISAAVKFVGHAAIAMEGPMAPVSVADVGYVLELLGEEGDRINNDIDRMNGGA
jgi:hypothetical protein